MKEHQFQFSDGRHLNWYEVGTGRPLVLLHGWAMSGAAFSELAALLADQYHLLIPDLPGHGKSSPALQNDLAGLAANLVTWLEAVTEGPVTLAGWSLGGMLALQIASDETLPVERLALIGTTPRFTNTEGWNFGLPATQVKALVRNLKRRFEATLGEFFALTFAGETISRERMREIRQFAVRSSGLPDRDVAVALLHLLTVQDQRALLAGITQPVMVLHGALDQISPAGSGRYMAETLPQGSMVELADVGHAPFLSQPDVVAAKLREFC